MFTKKRKVSTPDGSVDEEMMASSPGGSRHQHRKNLKAAKRGEDLLAEPKNPEFLQLKSTLYKKGVEEIMSSSAYKGPMGLFAPQGPKLNDIDKDGDPHPNFVNQSLVDLRWKLSSLKDRYDRPTGDVIAMGQEDTGQLGLVTLVGKTKLNGFPPTLNQSLRSNIIQVAAGGMHSVALKENGSAYTWGCSDDGALGRVYEVDDDDDDAEERNSTTPTQVTQLIPSKQYAVSNHFVRSPTNECNDIIQIACGSSHSVFLTISGNVYVAGFYKDMDSGKFCDLRPMDDLSPKYPKECPNDSCEGNRFTPVHIYQMPNRVKYVAAGGSFNAAILDDDSLVTWGMGQTGELARSEQQTNLVIQEGAEGYNHPNEPDLGHALYRRTIEGKKVYLQDVLKEHFLKPKPVIWADGSGSAGCLARKVVTHVACGIQHLLVAARSPQDSSSRLYSAGVNTYGKLGHGDEIARHSLTLVKALQGVPIERVAAGNDHSLILNAKGDTIFACGQNSYGQLGIDKKNLTTKKNELVSEKQRVGFTLTPMPVAFPTTTTADSNDGTTTSLDKIGRFVDIQCGESHSIAITSTGKIYTWGYGEYGQAGNDPNIHTDDITQPRLNEDWLLSSKKDAADTELCVHNASGGTQHTLIVATRYSKKN